MTSRQRLARRIGGKVSRARKAAGMTRAELAVSLDISRQHVWQIESGRCVPGVAILTAIKDVLGLEVI